MVSLTIVVRLNLAAILSTWDGFCNRPGASITLAQRPLLYGCKIPALPEIPQPGLVLPGTGAPGDETTMSFEWPLRQQLVEIAQRCEAYGLVLRSQGNFSVRLPNSDRALITPSGVPYGTMKPGDIIEVDLDGRLQSAPHPPSYELPVHLAAYRADVRIRACAHTEPPYINALYALDGTLPNVLGNFVYAFGGRGLAIGPRMRSGTAAFGEASIRAMGDRFGVVWPNHGLFCIGRDLEVAFMRSLYAEQAAQVYYLAISLDGREPAIFPPDQEAEILASSQQDGWDQP